LLVVGVLAVGCGGGSSDNRTLAIEDTGWDESVAISIFRKNPYTTLNCTKAEERGAVVAAWSIWSCVPVWQWRSGKGFR
jgi:hypothetical protein